MACQWLLFSQRIWAVPKSKVVNQATAGGNSFPTTSKIESPKKLHLAKDNKFSSLGRKFSNFSKKVYVDK